MGQTSLEELKMELYSKDSTANAVVLYEHANVYLDPNYDYNTRTDYYYRIKIFNKAAFDLANITVNLYKEKRITDIKAITYNLVGNRMQKNYLPEADIFETKEGEDWVVKKFTLPNIQEGSVIEYKYSIISPYSGIEDWEFQSDIPKIKSEFDAAIIGNYKYNVRLIGFLSLDKDKPSVKKNCVYIDGLGEGACAIYSYGMNNIPAFKEEDFMLSKKNFLSKLSFDLESFTSPKGSIKKYATTWEQADRTLKSQFFNNQTSKKNYFKRRIPEDILNTKNNLERAQKIYTFIQNHYTWNQRFWNNEDAKVKEAFDDKTGDVAEINLSLYNSLNAADLKTNLVVLSTRNHGIPTKLYPVIYDYNYVIVKATINGKDYYLDATEKFLPFGQVPVRTLNGEARVIDFDDKSNWVTLKSKESTTKTITAKLILNEDGEFNGSIISRKTGYHASNQREKLAITSKENYLEEFESENPDLEVEDYKIKNEKELNNPLQEMFKVKIFMNENLGKKARINPFFFERLKTNPFKLKERFYPVDFAYPRKSNYALSLQIPKNYKIMQLPKDVAIALPNNGGSFILKTKQKNNFVTIYARLNISKKIYSSEEYYALKEFFKQIIIAENSSIILKKQA